MPSDFNQYDDRYLSRTLEEFMNYIGDVCN